MQREHFAQDVGWLLTCNPECLSEVDERQSFLRRAEIPSARIHTGPPAEPSDGVEGDLSTVQRSHCCDAEAMPVHKRTQGRIAVRAQECNGFVTPNTGAAFCEYGATTWKAVRQLTDPRCTRGSRRRCPCPCVRCPAEEP